MGIKDAVVQRFSEICAQKNIKINELANRAGVTPSTVYSMFDARRREVSINLIKKLCDGLDMTLGEFFGAEAFDELEQEIR
ncbi:helix-turn-helix domain-containing protein [Bacillota bacterium Meth-B3]|nr:helix-turn-helix transcriptional regulator [Christensenellaceae bacterium]MEA5065985.1 helix-turn-helix transcriptional regulator [Eubacteriales bacterium]MEA5069853.1 helix-turn-helix transcriptional regulator [Christensenellaceae bacterium]